MTILSNTKHTYCHNKKTRSVKPVVDPGGGLLGLEPTLFLTIIAVERRHMVHRWNPPFAIG